MAGDDALTAPVLTWRELPAADRDRYTRVWLDVGAHRGQYTFHEAAADAGLLVYAFEPNLAVASATIGRLPNYVVLPYAVSEQDGAADFNINDYDYSSSLLPLNPERAVNGTITLRSGEMLHEQATVAVPTVRLDTFMTSMGLEKVDLLKVDAQGADLSVLRSAGAFLSRIDCVVIEATIAEEVTYHGSPTKAEIVDFLSEAGFSLVASERQSNGEEENLTFLRTGPGRSGDAGSVRIGVALPRVSVVVPSYNNGRFIRRAIDSILAQGYPNLECIVMDAASTDDTVAILESYGDRIRWVSEKDEGPFDAINKGWAQTDGEIIAWLNSDDVWEPLAVHRAVNYLMAHPDVDVVHGSCGLTDIEGNQKWLMPTPKWDVRTAIEYCDHIIYQATTFMRRTAVARAGWLYPAWIHDHELWIQISLTGGKIVGLPFHLASAREEQPENHRSLPWRYGATKVEMTKRLFASESLPGQIRPLRRRAMSNAYARGLDFCHLKYRSHWAFGARALALAIATDPTNLPGITRDIRTRIVWRFPVVFALRRPLRLGRAVLRPRRSWRRVFAVAVAAAIYLDVRGLIKADLETRRR